MAGGKNNNFVINKPNFKKNPALVLVPDYGHLPLSTQPKQGICVFVVNKGACEQKSAPCLQLCKLL